ncbi:TA system antitoxin ParD family protein [Nocardioides massiliensis]|uniref:ParD-like antitoxin of type II toxin-antitoxin system n=1 Tax=Nocardioides massiliensis TaxID=1325935 RepID=A0ABT9NRD0_9ACTN|nr:hypothetical protein [Nocardioides massiliensis]MDP9822981.1 hypothetical protein [Nocardioides massiliensis]
MGARAERVTRFDEDLFAAAAAEGPRQSRSARQQLEHWARLGAALSAQFDAPLNRVRLAVEGRIAQRDLTRDEARQFDAVITAGIDAAVAEADFAAAPLPDFSAVTPDPQRVLADLAAREQLGADARQRLRAAVADLADVLDEPASVEAGR